MHIGIDWDGTYDLDIKTWNQVTATFRLHGHKVYLVTARSGDEDDNYVLLAVMRGRVDGIYFTDKQAKEDFMISQGVHIDVWIDNEPRFILEDKD